MYGLIGKTLKHSFSKKIHNLIGNYTYNLIEKDEKEAIEFIKSKKFKGLNVTIPYKKTFIKYLDEISDNGKKIGCINTIINKNNKLYGYNTDYFGMESMILKNKININNKIVLILGNGATSLTAKAVVKDLFPKYVLVAARHGDLKFTDYEKIKKAEVIINTTPVGMYPHNLESLIDLEKFENLEAVIDVVYNPINTKILLDGKIINKRGIKSIKTENGLSMLINQAIKSSELFFDKKYDNDLYQLILNKIKCENLNISIIGMPGSGKTTISRVLSKISGKKFVDLDLMIEKKENMKINEIFEKKGESYFRNIESIILREVSKKQNQIISTGGGIVENMENYYPLKENSIIFLLKRDLKNLDLKNRPLFKKNSVLELYEKRKANYEYFKDFEVINKETNNSEDIESVARNIYRLFSENLQI